MTLAPSLMCTGLGAPYVRLNCGHSQGLATRSSFHGRRAVGDCFTDITLLARGRQKGERGWTLSGPKETPLPHILLVRQTPAFLRSLGSLSLSNNGVRSVTTGRRDKWLSAVPISIS